MNVLPTTVAVSRGRRLLSRGRAFFPSCCRRRRRGFTFRFLAREKDGSGAARRAACAFHFSSAVMMFTCHCIIKYTQGIHALSERQKSLHLRRHCCVKPIKRREFSRGNLLFIKFIIKYDGCSRRRLKEAFP